jgi:hypothetical protein
MNLKTKSHGQKWTNASLSFNRTIIKKKKDRGASYEEISDFLEDKFQEKGLTLKFTERTFQRDKVAIADVFGIQISFLESEMYIL